MKISVDDIELFTLSETQKSVIKDYVHEDIFDEDMKRRLRWVLMHLYEESFKKLKNEWDQKLFENGIESIPTHPDAYAKLVFSLPQYKDRKDREAASLENK